MLAEVLLCAQWREGGRAPRTSLKPRNSMSVGHNHMFARRPAAGARGGPSQMMCEGTSHAWAHAWGGDRHRGRGYGLRYKYNLRYMSGIA